MTKLFAVVNGEVIESSGREYFAYIYAHTFPAK